MRARWAKISMMRPTRSTTGRPHAASRLRSCTPLNSALTKTLHKEGELALSQISHMCIITCSMLPQGGNRCAFVHHITRSSCQQAG